MTSTLERKIEYIIEQLDPAQRWLTQVLAVCLPMPIDDLVTTAARASSRFSAESLDQAATSLARSSIVDTFEDGIGLRSQLAGPVATGFVERDPVGLLWLTKPSWSTSRVISSAT